MLSAVMKAILAGSGGGGAPTLASLGYIGGNVSPSVDYVTSYLYNNACRDTRGFTAYNTGSTPTTLDSNGWPTGPATLILSTPPGYGLPAGNYYISIQSPGQSVTLTAYDTTVLGAPVLLPDGVTTRYPITIAATGNNGVNCSGACTNWDLPRDGSLSSAGESTYSPFMLASISAVETIRVMDWLGTNSRTDTTWSTAPPAWVCKPYGAGFPSWSEFVTFINTLVAYPGSRVKNVMMNIPPYVDDNYVTTLVQYLNTLGLTSSVKLLIQLSNEVWNTQFNSNHAYLQSAMAELQMCQGYNNYGSSSPFYLASVTGNGTNLTFVLNTAIDSWFPGAAGTTKACYMGSNDSTVNPGYNTTGKPLLAGTATKVNSTTFTVPSTVTAPGQVHVAFNTTSTLLGAGELPGAIQVFETWYVRRTHQMQVEWSAYRPQDLWYLDQIMGPDSQTDLMFRYADWLGGGTNEAGTWLYGTAIGMYITASGSDSTLDQLFSDLNSSLTTTIAANVSDVVYRNKLRGMHAMCYEAGIDMQQCYSLIVGAMTDPRVGTLTTAQMNLWFGYGGEHFGYEAISPGVWTNTQQGGWPALQSYTDTTSYRYNALIAERTQTITYQNGNGSPGTVLMGTGALPGSYNTSNSLMGLFNPGSAYAYTLLAIPYPGGNYKLTANGGGNVTGRLANYYLDGGATIAGSSTLPNTGSGFGVATSANCADVANPVTLALAPGVHVLQIQLPVSNYNDACLYEIKTTLLVPAAPVMTSAPVLSVPLVGYGVTWVSGTASGFPPPTFTDVLFKNGVPVSSPATSGTYTSFVAGDVFTVAETPTNSQGAGAALTSAPVTAIANPEAAAVAAAQRNGASLWYVKSDLSNVFSDSGGTTTAALNGPVGMVKDVTGAHNASQATSASRPTLVAGPTPYPLLSFNGSNYLLHSLGAAMGSAHSLIAAGTALGASSSYVLAAAGESNILSRVSSLEVDAGVLTVESVNDAVTVTKVSGSGGESSVALTVSSIATTTSFTVYKLGLSIGSASQAGGATSIVGGSIGTYRSNGSNGWIGTIGLICESLTTMPDADRRAIEQFGAYITGAVYAG